MSLVARGLGRSASVIVTAGLGRVRALLFAPLAGALERARVSGPRLPESTARDRATERASVDHGSTDDVASVRVGSNNCSRTA